MEAGAACVCTSPGRELDALHVDDVPDVLRRREAVRDVHVILDETLEPPEATTRNQGGRQGAMALPSVESTVGLEGDGEEGIHGGSFDVVPPDVGLSGL